MACLPWASFLFVPSLAFWVSGVGQLSPEVGEGEGGGLRYNAVSDDAESSGASEVHPGSHPISHSAKRGFSWRLLDKVVNKASSRSSCSSPALSAIPPRSRCRGTVRQVVPHSLLRRPEDVCVATAAGEPAVFRFLDQPPLHQLDDRRAD